MGAIPLTVVGGFLGAGKTTLLNRLLAGSDRRIAVVVNDFGAIDIDGDLLRARDGDTISLTNGCVCCRLGGELTFALAGLRDRPDPPEHVVIEASGVGDVAAIAAFGSIPGFRDEAAIVVADAAGLGEGARDPRTAAHVRRQLEAADLIVVSKADLVAADVLAAVRARLRGTAPSAAVVEATFGDVPPDVLLGARDRAARPRPDPAADAHPGYASWSWSGAGALDGAGLAAMVGALPHGVLRAKGILHLREEPDHRFVLQLVGRRGSIRRDRAWCDEPPSSRLVVIGHPEAVDRTALDAAMESLGPRSG